jgi:hypothetical protein
VVGVYVSPNSSLDAYGDFLDGVSNCTRRRCRSRQVLILGDFNARPSQWGDTRTNTRGRMLSDWAAGLGLLLTNKGSTSTCVAWRGSSVIDIMWTTASLHRQIHNWRVAEEVETLPDHLYIMMELTETASTRQDRSDTRDPSRSRPPPTPRWRLKERDRDLLQAAVTVSAWCWDARATQEGIDEEAESLQRDMSAACDASMSRSIPGGGTRNHCAYWWTEEIAELRRECALARRRLQRARRKRRCDEEEISHCYEGYREKRRALQQEIQNAKARSWMELVESVESDPWGRPYRLVTKKLRPPARKHGTKVARQCHRNLVPTAAGQQGQRQHEADTILSPQRDHEVERRATSHPRGALRGNKKDGIPRRRNTGTGRNLRPGLGRVNEDPDSPSAKPVHQMPEGRSIPPAWRTERLILLSKEGHPLDSPSAYRPICLLDEVGKLFERIIAARLEAHMTERAPVWHDSQFGFRRGRSVNAVKQVRATTEAMVSRKGVALAVSLDVTNAFNTIPWDGIIEALERFRVPPYLVRLIRSYLNDRWIVYTGKNGEEKRPVECGVESVSHRGRYWDPFCGSRHMTQSSDAPCHRARTWYAMQTTPWSWPGAAGGTRHRGSRRPPWHVQCAPSGDWS